MIFGYSSGQLDFYNGFLKKNEADYSEDDGTLETLPLNKVSGLCQDTLIKVFFDYFNQKLSVGPSNRFGEYSPETMNALLNRLDPIKI